MSISPAQLASFAEQINNHEALEAVKERVSMRIFNKWRTSDDDKRAILTSTLDAGDLFFKELSVIIAEHEITLEQQEDRL